MYDHHNHHNHHHHYHHYHYCSTQQQRKGLKMTCLEPLVSFLFFFLYSTNFFYRTMCMYKDHNNHHQLERILAETEFEVGGKKNWFAASSLWLQTQLGPVNNQTSSTVSLLPYNIRNETRRLRLPLPSSPPFFTTTVPAFGHQPAFIAQTMLHCLF